MVQQMRVLPVKMTVERLKYVLDNGITTLHSIECKGSLHASQDGGILVKTSHVRQKVYGGTHTFFLKEIHTTCHLAHTS